jgi:hypothetical protein
MVSGSMPIRIISMSLQALTNSTMGYQAPIVIGGKSLTPEHFIDTDTLSDLLSLTPGYLKQLRVLGGGPRFHKLTAKSVRYRVADALEWAASRPAAVSTSELVGAR